mmetsp:Transcript_18188/g.18238  ORF Transcript_18188/g.18238 Transcript_18188/m.18238 type:complete len:285 (-) Transcript_18188:116-970(-)
MAMMKFSYHTILILSLSILSNGFVWKPMSSSQRHFSASSMRPTEIISLQSSVDSIESSLFRASDQPEDEAPKVDASILVDLKTSPDFAANLNGSDVRVGIIMARWNEDIIKNLYKGVNESLSELGVKPSNIFTTYVPGSFELPITARFLAMSKRVDVIICMGCLIKGDTMHFEYISGAVSDGIMKVSLDTLVPCIFGVLTVLNPEQAKERSTGNDNLGLGWGKAAVEMGLARMSALGMGKMGSKATEPDTAFQKFNTSSSTVLPPLPNGDKEEKKEEKKKKIGF